MLHRVLLIGTQVIPLLLKMIKSVAYHWWLGCFAIDCCHQHCVGMACPSLPLVSLIVLSPLALKGAIEDRPDCFMYRGMTGGDVEKLLGGVWALVAQLVTRNYHIILDRYTPTTSTMLGSS